MGAEQSDWTLLGESIDRLTIGLRHHLRGQKDEPLAELAFIGQWLRTLQTCHAVVIAKALSNQELAIGSPLLISEMTRRLNLMSDPATESVTCLKLLHRRLAGLSRLWPEDGGMVINPEDRLRKSAELLGDTVGKLLEEETAAGAANAVNP